MFEKFSQWFVNDCKHKIKCNLSANASKRNTIHLKGLRATKTRHCRIQKK